MDRKREEDLQQPIVKIEMQPFLLSFLLALKPFDCIDIGLLDFPFLGAINEHNF